MWFKHALSRRLFAFLWATTAVLVIGLALLVSVARLLLPLLDHYRVEVEQLAGNQVGRPVRIGEITAGWQGLHPDLLLRDVRILSADGSTTWLAMREVRASVDLVQSLRQGRLETGRISLVGGSLDIVRHADGSFSVAGVPTGFGGVAGHGGRGLLDWLMKRERVGLEDATLRWRDARISTRPLELSGLSLELRRIDGRYRLGGAGRFDGAAAGNLRFALDLAGDPQRPESLRSRFYAEGSAVLGAWLDGSAFADVEQLGGSVSFSLWADGADQLQRLRGKVHSTDLVWQPRIEPQQGGPVAAARFDEANATVFWRRQRNGWRLGLEEVQIVRNGRHWPQTALQLSVAPSAASGNGWQLALPFVRLEDVNAVLLTVPGLDPAARRAAAELAPSGDLRRLQVRYDPAAGNSAWYAAAQFEDLSVQPWRRFPGLAGVDGTLRMNGEHGYLSLDSRQVRFDYPRLFREPLQAQQVSGQLYWYPGPDGLRLYVPHFDAQNDDVRARGRLQMDLPASGASPFLDLAADFRDAEVARAPHYLPTGIMHDDVVEWLDRALAGGRVDSGRLLFFGRLSDFPYTRDDGTFRVDFGVHDLLLDYAPGWPRLEQATASVRFSDRSLGAEVHGGRMLGLAIEGSRVAIPSMGHGAVLQLDSAATGPLQDFFAYLRAGPLAKKRPQIVDELELANEARAQVSVRLPLHDHERVQVTGDVRFDDDLVAWPRWDVRFERLRGALKFAYRTGSMSYESDDMQLQWRKAPAKLQVHTSAVGDETQVQLVLATRNEAAPLLGAQGARLAAIMRGKSDWELRATVHQPDDDARPVTLDLQAQSDLRGIEVALPPPLGKSAEAGRPSVLQTTLTEQGVVSMRVYYGSLVNGAFALADGKLQRGELRFGSAQATLPPEPGLRAAGVIEQLSVRDWDQWLHSADAGAGATGGWADALNAVDVQFGRLHVSGYGLHDLHLVARRAEGQWRAQVAAQEIEGEIRMPTEGAQGGALVADLRRLDVPQREPAPAADEAGARIDPAALPALRVEADRFSYGGAALGKLVLVADPVPGGLRVTQLSLDAADFSAAASGQWRQGPRGQLCDFTIDASTADLGRALQASGYADAVEHGAGTFHIEAQWPGSPTDFRLKNLDGKVALAIKDGQLLELNPRGGRIFGLLSLQALPRRLALDFSDLFRRGFAFDRIQGTFSIADGDAYTNDLYMEGPAARIDVSGRIGLAAEDYDQTALVTPRVSASIPVVGGLAGGPAVGLGLWVAERMFGKKIDELSRVRYNITGSWQDPVVSRVEDAG